MQLILLEINEVNFDHLAVYAANGEAPHLKRLIDQHGISTTVSEQRYEELEPWIQWVTAHTGLTYRDHGVFRLGDIVNHDIVQIWERLEQQGLRIGAISPMNAKNRTADAAFFIPDPWTATTVTGSALSKRLYAAIAQTVNDNAHSRVTVASAAWLLAGLLRYARLENYALYAQLAASLVGKPWRKAMLLDLLFSDLFVRETRRTRPHFASLFLNGGAHIQHHYMFNSRAYAGEQKNPEWYISPREDPVGEVYRLYDRVVGQIRAAFPAARLLIATALHQDPHAEVTYYWRLKHHASFLTRIGVPFERVEARMSRDFLIGCASNEDALRAESVLRSAKASDGTPLFEVDNRGRDVFVMLTWSKGIERGFACSAAGKPIRDFENDVAFVAIKNGEHNGTGYFIDTHSASGDDAASFHLHELPRRICSALGADWERDLGKAA